MTEKTNNNKNTEDNSIKNITEHLYDVIKDLEFDEIKGEIISIKPSDKHQYITIKNGDYQINCISWNKCYENLKDGDNIKINGFLNVLKKNLSIYYNIKKLEKVGSGNYMNSFIELKNKIISMGWSLNKKSITLFPYNIGIISALEGAAIQDILQTFKLDNLIGNVYIKNAIVQGKQCPSSVINGIKYFDNFNNLDLLLITRGGGSNEDLIGFSDFDLLQEIHNCKLVTISAVGHQIDNQLSDIVCDYNFATPSIAAKFIVEKQKEYLKNITEFKIGIDKILEKLNESKIIFKNVNYNNIVKNLEEKELKDKILIYKNNLNSIISLYSRSKVRFLNELSKLKPTIYKNNIELSSITDFIDPETNIEKRNKKIEIIFNDGKININYKIISYEKFDN
jgi:exodeoxyribonuclease VII large subunit